MLSESRGNSLIRYLNKSYLSGDQNKLVTGKVRAISHFGRERDVRYFVGDTLILFLFVIGQNDEVDWFCFFHHGLLVTLSESGILGDGLCLAGEYMAWLGISGSFWSSSDYFLSFFHSFAQVEKLNSGRWRPKYQLGYKVNLKNIVWVWGENGLPNPGPRTADIPAQS